VRSNQFFLISKVLDVDDIDRAGLGGVHLLLEFIIAYVQQLPTVIVGARAFQMALALVVHVPLLGRDCRTRAAADAIRSVVRDAVLWHGPEKKLVAFKAFAWWLT